MKSQSLKAFAGLVFVTAFSASAADLQQPGWRAHLEAAALASTAGGGAKASLGFGLGIEVRTSERLGFSLTAASADAESELEIGFFDLATISVDSTLRTTPILARLDLHLTPHQRADLFLGPVVGYVLYGDQEFRIRGTGAGEELGATVRVPTKDGFAWGAQLGVHAPLGRSKLYWTARATYLKAEVELAEQDEELGALRFDLDPLLLEVGVGLRF